MYSHGWRILKNAASFTQVLLYEGLLNAVGTHQSEEDPRATRNTLAALFRNTRRSGMSWGITTCEQWDRPPYMACA